MTAESASVARFTIPNAVNARCADLGSALKLQLFVIGTLAMKKTGTELIAEERQRQIEKEKYTSNHDDYHLGNELALAAVCYALPKNLREKEIWSERLADKLWPWNENCWKPGDRIRELTKAGALIAAEIDRLQRNISQ